MSGGTASGQSDGDKLRDLSYLAGAVSHHVINAFSAIVSNAELIRSREGGVTEAADHELLGTSVVDTAIEASRIARKLIDWARKASAVDGDLPADKGPAVDLDQLVREAVETARAGGPAEVNWVLNPGSVGTIVGDAPALRAMLAYLLENGLESLAGGSGTIEISTYFDARSWLVLAIRDTGCGMSQEVLRRATEPFFSTKAEHAGVGLTIAQAIWRRNRGALSIESQPGEGTTVRLSMVPSTPPAAVKAPARRPGAPERGH